MALNFSAALARTPLRAFQWITAAVCMLVLVIDGVDMQLLGLVAPRVIEEFGVERSDFGTAMSAALVGMAIGAWSGGWLGDRIGRRNSLALAVTVFGLATMGASQADGTQSMALWRAMGGLGFGAAFPNSLALTSEWLPDRWRPYAITMLSVGTPAGGAVVALIADSMLDAFGWRGTFLVIGAATLFVVLLILAVLRDSPPYLQAKGRLREAQNNARKVLGKDYVLPNAPALADTKAGQDGEPLVKMGVFHASNARLNWGVGIGFAASTMVAYGIINWVTTLLTAAHYTLEQALRAASFSSIASIFGALLAGYLAQRVGSRRIMLGVSVILVGLLIVLARAVEWMPDNPSNSYRLMVDCLIGAVGFVVSTGIATIYVMITLGYPLECRSSGIGFGMFAGRAGGIVVSFIGGWLIDFGEGSLLPFFITLGAAALLIMLASFVVDRHVEPVPVVKDQRNSAAVSL